MKELEPKPGSWRSRIDDPCPVFHYNNIREHGVMLTVCLAGGLFLAWLIMMIADGYGLLNWLKINP